MHAQQAFTAGGGDGTGAGGSVAFSTGQIAYTVMTGDGSAGGGVQQPYEIFELGTGESSNIALEAKAYPNPAVSAVTLHIESNTGRQFRYRLTDLPQCHINSNITTV